MNLIEQETHPNSDFNPLSDEIRKALQDYLRLLEESETNTRLAYAAGYFDGEGCITSGDTVVIKITSSDFWSLQVFSELFGGNIDELPENQKLSCTPGHRMFRWALGGSKTISPLRAMLPYLRSKHVEAEKVINAGLEYGWDRIPQEQKEIRRKLENDLKSLKCCGRQKEYPPTKLVNKSRVPEWFFDLMKYRKKQAK